MNEKGSDRQKGGGGQKDALNITNKARQGDARRDTTRHDTNHHRYKPRKRHHHLHHHRQSSGELEPKRAKYGQVTARGKPQSVWYRHTILTFKISSADGRLDGKVCMHQTISSCALFGAVLIKSAGSRTDASSVHSGFVCTGEEAELSDKLSIVESRCINTGRSVPEESSPRSRVRVSARSMYYPRRR